jgi:hypothetical protein
MNALSLQNLIDTPGARPVRMVSGLGQPQTDDEFGLNLDPDFAPWWKEMPTPKVIQSASTGARATPPDGYLRKAGSGYRESYPLTVSNDERNLPTPSGKPLLRLKGEKFTRVYPHTETDYSELRPQVFPEIGPTPSGWMAPPRIADEEARAVNAVVGAPAAYPEDMTTDISGFGSLHEAFMGQIPGMVVSLDDPAPAAAQKAVVQQAAQAQAAGASPSTVDKIINFGAQFIAGALKGTAPAAKPTLPAAILGADQPFYTRPLFLGGVAVLAGVGVYVATRDGGGKRRRSRGTTRRYRR